MSDDVVEESVTRPGFWNSLKRKHEDDFEMPRKITNAQFHVMGPEEIRG
jgi:hypothetical protein